jgi:hypothetical protein
MEQKKGKGGRLYFKKNWEKAKERKGEIKEENKDGS